MHLPSHIQAFQAQWIIKYLDPHNSPWKNVLDHWFASDDRLGRGALVASSSHRRRLTQELPARCTYMHACLVAFNDLNIRQDLNLITFDTLGEPLWRNRRFKILIPSSSIDEWVENLNIYRLSDLATEGGLVSDADIRNRIDSTSPPGMTDDETNTWRLDRHREVRFFRLHISRDIKELMKKEPPDINPKDTVHLRVKSSGRYLYARYHHDDAYEPRLEELFLDTSRYPHPTGKFIDIDDTEDMTTVATWDAMNKHYQKPYAGDVDPDETPEERSAIIGPSHSSYPLNTGWYAEGQELSEDEPNGRLSDLTIHNITTILTNRLTAGLRPNSEEAWDLRLGPFRSDFFRKVIWPSLGTPLSDPTQKRKLSGASYTEPSMPRTATP